MTRDWIWEGEWQGVTSTWLSADGNPKNCPQEDNLSTSRSHRRRHHCRPGGEAYGAAGGIPDRLSSVLQWAKNAVTLP